MYPFDFSQTYILEDERVQLRPLLESDFEHLLHFSINEPTIWQYSLVGADGPDNLKKYIQGALNARAAEKEYAFIVFDKSTQQYAGCTRFYDIHLPFKTTQLGYTWYGSKFQGTGLNKHCKLLLLQFAFEEMQLARVEFRADNNNARSIAAMRSIGCTVEGVLRSHMPSQGEHRRDSIVLSILQDEWFDTVKNNLINKINTLKD